MDERELIRRYLQQQKPPILDDVMPDDSKLERPVKSSERYADNIPDTKNTGSVDGFRSI